MRLPSFTCVWYRQMLSMCCTTMFMCLYLTVGTDGADLRIRLKTGLLNPATARQESRVQREALSIPQHTSHPLWGAFGTKKQLLVTFRGNSTHDEQQQVLQLLQRQGAVLSDFVPDNTLLLLGDDNTAQTARQQQAVLWVDDFLPQYRVDPKLSSKAQLQALGFGGNVSSHANSLPNDRVGIWVRFAPSRLLGSGHGAISNDDSLTKAAAHDWVQPLRNMTGGSATLDAVGPHKVLVTTPVKFLSDVLQYLSHQPAVHWIEEKPQLRWNNYLATAVGQSQLPYDVGSSMAAAAAMPLNATLFPVWAAGLTGKNVVVGIGDSGIAWDSCFFTDSTIDLKNPASWSRQALLAGQPAVLAFKSATHRKIALYVAAADQYDSIGHGSHTAGSIAGNPTVDSPVAASMFKGMAYDARLAFFDLGSGRTGSVSIPSDLARGYYPYAYAEGAKVHSDSWGSDSLAYDSSAQEVDTFTWTNKDFLPIFAAGNFGGLTRAGSGTGEVTVTSPSTCKNCLSVGATPSYIAQGMPIRETYVVHQAIFRSAESRDVFWKLIQADFGGTGTSLYGKELPVVVAAPLDGCKPLTNAAAMVGAVALIERGTCRFDEKAAAAQAASAAAVIIYDNRAGSYFVINSDARNSTITIPVLMLPRRAGMELQSIVSNGRMTVQLWDATDPTYSYQNLASYSSQGPTYGDGRIKPDILAVGSTSSAAVPGQRNVAASFSQNCAIQSQQGTSMSTPIVAGAAALIYQYFRDGFYPSGAASSATFAASAALVKAMLLGGAQQINGYEQDTGLPLDPVPSSRQGFGALYLAQSLFLKGVSPFNLQVVDKATLRAGEQHTYCLSAQASGPTKITLVWWDYPGSPAASKALVNNLDLTVFSSDGVVLRGNSGASNDAALPDSVNTVEQAILNRQKAVTFAIRVTATAVGLTLGAQPYALAVHGAFTGQLNSTFNPMTLDPSAIVPCTGIPNL